MNKILKNKNLTKIKFIKKIKKKIVLCHGILIFCTLVILTLKTGKEWNILIVSVASDNFVNKGPNRPI